MRNRGASIACEIDVAIKLDTFAPGFSEKWRKRLRRSVNPEELQHTFPPAHFRAAPATAAVSQPVERPRGVHDMATDPLPPDDINPQPPPPERDPADTDWVTPAEGAEIARAAAEHTPPSA